MTDDQIKTISEAADRFHKILSAIASARMIDDRGHKMTQPMYDAIAAKLLTPSDIERIAADGFEALVMMLAAAGVPGCTVHECNPTEEP